MAFNQLTNRMTVVDDENEGLIHRNFSSVLIRSFSCRLAVQEWLDDTSEVPGLDRFGEHGQSPQFLKAPTGFPVASSSGHDHRDRRQAGGSLDLGKKGKTVELGHLEIRQYQGIPGLAQTA